MLIVIGILLLLAGGILLALALTRARGVRLLFSQPVTLNALTRFDELALKFTGICRAALYLSIEGQDVTTGSNDSEFIHHEILYRFPITLKYFDSSNNMILEQNLTADCHKDTARVVELDEVNESGGALKLEHRLERFKAPRSAVQRIEAQLSADTEYHNRLNYAELRLYDSMSKHVPGMILASAFLFLGLIFSVVGLLTSISEL